MKIRLEHTTRYDFAAPATLGPHLIRLKPAPHNRTQVDSYALDIGGVEHKLYWQQDIHGNFVARAIFTGATEALEVGVALEIDFVPGNPFDFLVAPEAQSWPFAYAVEDAPDLFPYLETGPVGERFTAFVAGISRAPQETVGFLVDLNTHLREAVDYETRDMHGTRSPDETLTIGSGSCRDSAWLLIMVLRHLGLAARFVSGYLVELEEGGGEDRGSFHAWAEVYIPGAGWIGLDPSSGLLAGANHVPVAATRHWRQAAPVTGTASEVAELTHTLALVRL